MLDLENYEIYEIVNILGFVLGLLFGAVAQKNQFCFSGSIKDYMLTRSTKRGASVVMAILVAIISTYAVSVYFDIDLTDSVYYKDNINYFSLIFGGALFGAGMMLADGCSSRHLVKFAQGDPYSLVVLLFIGIFAFATVSGVLSPVIDLFTKNELLLSLSSKLHNSKLPILLVVLPLLVYLWILTKSVKKIFTLVDGVIIGLIIAAAWYVTGVIGSESMEREIKLASMAFVFPTARTLEFFAFYEVTELQFAIAVILGILVGAFLMSKVNKKYSFGCTSNLQRSKIKYNMIGGAMMGIGGVLAIGCTVGQGLTGVSTLALASVIAINSILISGLITAQILAKKDLLPMCFIFEWDDNK
jgi:uncharacterized membrane protein YedE/YeeE